MPTRIPTTKATTTKLELAPVIAMIRVYTPLGFQVCRLKLLHYISLHKLRYCRYLFVPLHALGMNEQVWHLLHLLYVEGPVEGHVTAATVGTYMQEASGP